MRNGFTTLTIPPVKHPRRPRQRRRPRVAPAPPPLVLVEVLGPVSVGVDEIGVTLVFDATAEHPLAEVGSADPAKWTARYQGTRYVGYQVNLDGFDRIALLLAPAGAEAGPDVVGYANAPSDIADTQGRQLAALAEFPL